MTAPPERPDALAGYLDDVANEITGRPHGAAPRRSPESPQRRRLLLGAALLAGRGDLAQEAVHVASARAATAVGGGAAGAAGNVAEREVLRAVRELRDGRA